MPYKIKHRGSGFKVTTPNHPQGFSKHPLSKKKAVAQLRAIKMNTNECLAEALDIVNDLISECSGHCTVCNRYSDRLEHRPGKVLCPSCANKAVTPTAKACNFSGVGYSGGGMHVVGGSGGLNRGGMSA